jgi:hypothetical protein
MYVEGTWPVHKVQQVREEKMEFNILRMQTHLEILLAKITTHTILQLPRLQIKPSAK